MCRFSPFGRTKGHPEGNCDVIISHEIKKVNKVANIDEPRDFFDIEFVRPQMVKIEEKVSDTVVKPSDNRRIPSDCSQQEKAVIEYLFENQTIKSKQVEKLLNIKESRTRELLQTMVEKEYLVKLGSARNTHYKLSKAVGDE